MASWLQLASPCSVSGDFVAASSRASSSLTSPPPLHHLVMFAELLSAQDTALPCNCIVLLNNIQTTCLASGGAPPRFPLQLHLLPLPTTSPTAHHGNIIAVTPPSARHLPPHGPTRRWDGGHQPLNGEPTKSQGDWAPYYADSASGLEPRASASKFLLVTLNHNFSAHASSTSSTIFSF